jgi:hypothetical protein
MQASADDALAFETFEDKKNLTGRIKRCRLEVRVGLSRVDRCAAGFRRGDSDTTGVPPPPTVVRAGLAIVYTSKPLWHRNSSVKGRLKGIKMAVVF